MLEVTSSEFLYHHYPKLSEGDLTKLRASLVCEPTLALCTDEIRLGDYLYLGKGEEQTGGRKRKSILSDALEAVIGAIYLDGGFEAAGAFVRRFVLTDIEHKKLFYDSKTILQEVVQGSCDEPLVYELTGESGPDHAKHFSVEARMIRRKKYYVVYVKEGDQIVDILNLMAAHVSLLELENIRILKGMREAVNRQVNCETANISKTTSAACGQIQDIQLIRQRMGLESLPPLLREIAEARLEWPDVSLKELGSLLDHPVGKSGVNHRLRKLKELADSLRVIEEDVSC